jgi:hypothetical protein
MRGVMVSMLPNSMPILNAFMKRIFPSAAPLPIAAAKASVDIARARRTMAIKFM